ncbi:hypothetical protein BV20DRAFT_1032323 [Pilatotrama ljubarskyi]|nr:hypothetical protein BV20DRAFT_1032323 [Pilatotrama ljubarskyi]
MTSTMEDGLVSSKAIAHAALEERQTKLLTEEQEVAEGRVRYEAERLLDFYDELSDDKVAGEVAAMITQFNSIEHRVGKDTSRTLRLASLPLDDTTDLTEYTRMLDTLEGLESECRKLGGRVHSLLHLQGAESRLHLVLTNLSDIMQGHEESVAYAKGVVQCCKENYRMGLGTLTLG